jgi:hypothetical protein
MDSSDETSKSDQEPIPCQFCDDSEGDGVNYCQECKQCICNNDHGHKSYQLIRLDWSSDWGNFDQYCPSCFQDKINDGTFIVTKDNGNVDNNSDDIDNNLITESTSSSEEPENTIPKKYIVVYYPGQPGMANIRENPSLDAKIIGRACYGEILDVCQIINNTWIQILYNGCIGFIKIISDNDVLVSEYIKPIENNDDFTKQLIDSMKQVIDGLVKDNSRQKEKIQALITTLNLFK